MDSAIFSRLLSESDKNMTIIFDDWGQVEKLIYVQIELKVEFCQA